MMRRILFIFALSFTLMTGLNAKTIHWLTFIDTTSKEPDGSNDIGSADANTRKILYSRWIDIVNAALKDNGYNINTIDVCDGEATPENCKAIVEALDVDADDIVMFYYIGHGTENTQTSRFPLMVLENGTHDRLVPLSWVHNTLKGKGAKLTITIGMCCNARQGAIGRVAPSFSRNYGKAYIGDGNAENIKRMFLDYKGDLIVASASPDESSWGCNSTLGETDYFTMHFINAFTDIMNGNNDADWQDMLTTVKNNVYNDVKNNAGIQNYKRGATQTPMWENNLASTNRPHKTKPVEPKTTTPTNTDQKAKYVSALNDAFAYITSSNVDAAKRIACAEKIKSVFASDLIVRVLSQDGNVAVSRKSIKDYLGLISTNRMFQNVSVADLSIENGLITSLSVREVIKSKYNK